MQACSAAWMPPKKVQPALGQVGRHLRGRSHHKATVVNSLPGMSSGSSPSDGLAELLERR